MNNSSSFQNTAKQLIDYINREHIGPGFISKKLIDIFHSDLNSLHFYNSTVVFEKQTTKSFKRVFSNERL